MGIFKKTSEKIDAGSDIEGADSRKGFYWVDDQKGENVLWRLPRNVYWNDNVLVREDEYGVFFRDGKALAVFDRPDRYALTTENIPVLKEIIGTVVGSVQIGEFYWLQKREFRDKFGTSQPLAFRDNDFGVVQLRIFGQFSYKVTDPLLLITQFVGTKGMSTSAEIVDWVKSQIVMVLNDTLGELKLKKQMGVLDMPAYLQEIEQTVLTKLVSETGIYGLQVMKFAGLTISLPDEVQEAISKRGAMSALGVNYIQYQSGLAIENIGEGAAKGGGEGAGFAMMGAGMGAGFGMGNMMTQGMGNMQQPPPFGAGVACPKCGSPVAAGAKFCPECGQSMVPQSGGLCAACGAKLTPGAKFCPECGAKTGAPKCPKCGADAPPGTKFCPECGEKL
jgi:membrane protease subunit (stomatin/prohibitin family)